ncbi:hypothetical protein A6A04_05865 [Paramagnetospirillum marisnigri]|uniref:Flagellin C-terminal domain-containing protein n=1 Tax=Paramagnetospirillum marisnigri TaxID=1285242 RepID=A0A178MER0_9PROT|nr:flagellin [Paramagnetospirillum marisnigri]OAN46637.1 hypothetical protein A6A04_05865 [Paramagnetospirillum marisnigri]
MTRIGTLGANTAYVNRILDIQVQMQKDQYQFTEKIKSQYYSGIATETNSLLNFENEKATVDQFLTSNTSAKTKLDTIDISLTGIEKSLKNFRDQFSNFYSGNTTDQKRVEQIQEFAFQTMQAIQTYLGESNNGEYLFAGGRVTTDPVQLGATTLTQFQTTYDGSTRTWPTTRAAQLLDSFVGRADTTKLYFNATSGTIQAADADSLAPLASTASISITNSVSNNQTFQIRSHAAMNVGGSAMAETNGAGSGSPTISYGATPTQILPAATGDLNFAFAANGNLKITPTTANSLSALSAGSTFTINGSTGNAWDGAFKVVSNTNGVVEIATDTTKAKSESILQTGATAPLSLSRNYGAATSLTTGTVTFTATPQATPPALTGSTLVTVTSAGNDLGAYSAGDTISIGGSSYHNGTFTVASASATTVSFYVNTDALRVSQFIPQSGRNDVTIDFDVGPGETNDQLIAGGGTSGNTGYGTLTFSPTGTTGERITASGGATSFLDGSGNPYPAVGQVIHLSSSTGVNDGTYKITANNGNYIEVESTLLTTESVSTADIEASSWYKGDTMQIQHRVDNDRQVDMGVYASDPAFEKAFRALGLIAQGKFGTAGGLDQNQGRISQARYLITDSLESPAAGTPPFGAELRGDISMVQQRVGFVAYEINTKTQSLKSFKGFLDTRIAQIEVVDDASAAAALLADTNALQASYQSLAKIQSLSLLNYLS